MTTAARTMFVLIKVLSGDFATAMDWLEMQTRRMRWGFASSRLQGQAALVADLRALVDSASVQPGIIIQAENVDDAAHFKASCWLAEWKTFLWLANFNYKGITPCSTAVVDQFLHNFRPQDRGFRFEALQRCLWSTQQQHKRGWIREWRRRWRVKWAKLPVTPPISNEDIRHKAPGQHSEKKLKPLLPSTIEATSFCQYSKCYLLKPDLGSKIEASFLSTCQ